LIFKYQLLPRPSFASKSTLQDSRQCWQSLFVSINQPYGIAKSSKLVSISGPTLPLKGGWLVGWCDNPAHSRNTQGAAISASFPHVPNLTPSTSDTVPSIPYFLLMLHHPYHYSLLQASTLAL
jgi:hypothetical protein